MTLEEAIQHAEEVANQCGPCAEDHKQLAEWLRELQALKQEPTEFCVPREYNGSRPKKWVLFYDDVDVPSAVFEDEEQAYDRYWDAVQAWNCYLMVTCPRTLPGRSDSPDNLSKCKPRKTMIGTNDAMIEGMDNNTNQSKCEDMKLVRFGRTAPSMGGYVIGRCEGDAAPCTSDRAVMVSTKC
jgi:AhpD family alkylhydroperoxidase